MAHFRIENLSFAYPESKDRLSLKNISLNIEKGEYVVLCGKSGCGKTTLLKHLKPMLTPFGERKGNIFFNGEPIENAPIFDLASKIGFVMQSVEEQIVTDKVWHELSFGLENIGCEPALMRAKVAEMACYFGIQDWFHKDVATLSGGQKQLLNLASVMAMQPEVLILDEPTSQLDPLAASDFLNTVRKINTELGTTVIITEHRLEDIFPYADRAVVMDKGEIIADDTPKNIGRLLYEKKNDMFAAMPTPVRVFYGSGEEGNSPLTVREGRAWLGESLKNGVKQPGLTEIIDENPKETVLSMRDIRFRYERDGQDILRGVNADIPKGSLFAVVGGNGAGKSTALKAICGICRPYRGKVKIFGKALEKYKASELFKNCIAMLPQDPKTLFVKNTVGEDLLEMGAKKERIEETARICEIENLLERHPYDLSGGEQQRSALAKVLLTEPKLLLLDEPTKGIDSFFKEKFAAILQKLKAKGITVIMVSHDVEFCARYADYVGMFFDGQLLTADTPRRIFGNNSFYTTAANRMSRHVFSMAVTADDVVELYLKNKE